MDRVSIRVARRRLSEIVGAAERGESVVLTRHGREVARVVPAEPADGRGLPDLTEFRKTIAMKGKPLSASVVASHKRERY
jgi:prevent-host-death family protein